MNTNNLIIIIKNKCKKNKVYKLKIVIKNQYKKMK